MRKRICRGLSWGLFGLSLVMLLMMAASLLEFAWTSPSMGGFELLQGKMQLRWRGAVGRVSGPIPGWRVGAPKERRLMVNGPGNGWIGDRRWSVWFCNGRRLIGGTGPIGVGGSLMLHTIDVPLWRTAVVAAGAGAVLWVMSRRRTRPGQCAKCGYDLTGLGAGAACPECGRVGMAAMCARAVQTVWPSLAPSGATLCNPYRATDAFPT